MPFDERVRMALEALARPVAEFRAALTGALDQADAHLAAHAATPAVRTARVASELGPFAQGRVDATRFAMLFGAHADLDPMTADRLLAAVTTLREVLGRGDDLFVAHVPPDGTLGQTVADALAATGRAFGAVLATELLRSGSFVPEEHDGLLNARGFQSWTRTERRYAPPLIVTVPGAKLSVGALADFTDGREKIVLVVDGPAPPAALVRLITPGTLVLQTVDGEGLDRVATADGPAVAGLVPEGAAQFLHDPVAGREPWQRLSVRNVPEAPRNAIGGLSVWQMQEDVRQLEALAAAPLAAPLPAEAVTDASGDDAVNRLTSWLLRQSGLQEST